MTADADNSAPPAPMALTNAEAIVPLGQAELVPATTALVKQTTPLQAGTLTYTRAGVVLLFCLLLWGDFAWSMKERSAAPVLQILIKNFKASDQEMQLFMMVIPNAIGILLGPIISYRSDRHRGRWGRRIPFLMVSTPFALLAMLGLGFSPSMGTSLHQIMGRDSPGLDPMIRLCFGLFWVVFEVATVAGNSVFGGLINDVVPRQLLGSFYGLFRAFSLVAGMAFNFQLLGLAETHFKAIFISTGLLFGIGFSFMCLTVKEGQYPPPPPVETQARHRFWDSCRIYARECFSNPHYIWVIIAITLGTLTFNPVNNFSQPFARSLDISNDTYGKYIFATYAISLLMSVFLGYLADRFHPLRIGIIAMATYAAIALWGEFFSAKAAVLFTIHYHLFGTTGLIPVHLFAIALIGHGVISGMFFTCTASLSQRLFPRERFAQFASAASMVVAVGSMLLGWLTGKFFDFDDHHYRHAYLMGFILAVLGVVAMLIVHRRFMKLGGVKRYVAP